MKTPLVYVLAAALLLSACGTPDYSAFYNSFGRMASEYKPLTKGEKPNITETLDLERAIERYKANYTVLGTMEIKGDRIPNRYIVDFAATKGASFVLCAIYREEDRVVTYVVPVTKHLGTATTTGSISSMNPLAPSYNYNSQTEITQTEWQTRHYYIPQFRHCYVFYAPKV